MGRDAKKPNATSRATPATTDRGTAICNTNFNRDLPGVPSLSINYFLLMFPRTSSLSVLSRGCRYILRPTSPRAFFSLSARSFSAVDAAMADTSGVTADSLKNKLVEQLQAQHVEIEDLSGMF